MKKSIYICLSMLFSAFLVSCGGDDPLTGDINNPPEDPISDSYSVTSIKEASAFLSKATFGAKKADIKALKSLNNYETWLDQQFSQPPSYHLQWAYSHAKGIEGTADLKDSPDDWQTNAGALSYLQRDAWWDITTFGKDQLRQRVAFALSEILVISKNNGALLTQADSRMSYYDVLVKNALGNFETLLQDVTYHPSMGKYLSYLGNPKGNPVKGTHPDENYARELMQLFTIGLYELNEDGSQKLENGKPISTYSQKDIREMAKVFTGLTDQNGTFFIADGEISHASNIMPMIAVEEYHDRTEKNILGQTIPAGGNAVTDINQALHILFMHSNTAPFISKQLIQHLVTSNPSKQYVKRVAGVFNNNGSGVRGDLKAVIKAILLDKEAIRKNNHPANFGKFREPPLYFTHLFRAFNATNKLHILKQGNKPVYQYASFNFNGTGMMQQEGPLEALSVFNYFSPDDAPYGLKKQGLVAPELSIYGKGGIDDVLMGIINKNTFIYDTYELTINFDLSQEKEYVKNHDYSGLLDHLDLLLTAGALSNSTKTALLDYLNRAKDDDGNPLTVDQLSQYAIALVITSPDYALQR